MRVVDGTRERSGTVDRAGGRFVVGLDGESNDVAVVRNGAVRVVFGHGLRATLTRIDPLEQSGEEAAHAGHLMAPMSGAIVAVLVKPGERVEANAPLVVLEAMKMEHTIRAPAAGIVRSVNCAVGERVSEGADLVDLDDPPA